MSFTIEIGPFGNPVRTITGSRLSGIDATRVHTALSDVEFTVPYEPSLMDYAKDPFRAYSGDQLVFRGYLKEFDFSEADAQTKVYGVGVAQDLKSEGREIYFESIPAHEGIEQVWNDFTDFDVDVFGGDAGGRLMDDNELVYRADDTNDFDDILDVVPTDPVTIVDGRVTLLQSNHFEPTVGLNGGVVIGWESVYNAQDGGNDYVVLESQGQSITTSVASDYGLAGENVGTAVRVRLPDTDTDGNNLGPGMELTVDGQVMQQFSTCFTADDGTYAWYIQDIDGLEGDLEAGADYGVELTVTDECEIDGSTHTAEIDEIAVYDSRFAYTFEGEPLADDPVAISDGGANGGDTVELFEQGQQLTGSISPDYDLTADNVGTAVRVRLPDVDDDGFHTGPRMIFDMEGLDGQRLQTFPTCFAADDGTYAWYIQEDNGPAIDLEAGANYAITLTVTNECESTNSGVHSAYVDAIAVYDTRFDYTFPTDVESNGYLAGPELYPHAWDIVFDRQGTPFNVIRADLNTSWNDTSGNQSVGVSVDLGDSWTTSQNSPHVEADVPDNAGTNIDTRATLSRWGDRDNQAPTTGFQGQHIDAYELRYDGNELATIEDETYRGSPYDILVDMHEENGYRFVIDHAATDDAGQPINRAESFRRGTLARNDDWRVVNRNPSLSFTSYANIVTLWGEEDDNGERPMVTVKNQSEIDEWGPEPFSDVRPRLSTVEAVRSDARTTLREKVQERQLDGTIDVHPTNILPGYDYPVDWFQNGNPQETPLNNVEWSQGFQDASGRLQFAEELDVTTKVVAQGRRVRSVEESV